MRLFFREVLSNFLYKYVKHFYITCPKNNSVHQWSFTFYRKRENDNILMKKLELKNFRIIVCCEISVVWNATKLLARIFVAFYTTYLKDGSVFFSNKIKVSFLKHPLYRLYLYDINKQYGGSGAMKSRMNQFILENGKNLLVSAWILIFSQLTILILSLVPPISIILLHHC